MMPIVDGRVIEEEEFDKLADEIKKEYEEKSLIVQEQIMNTISTLDRVFQIKRYQNGNQMLLFLL